MTIMSPMERDLHTQKYKNQRRRKFMKKVAVYGLLGGLLLLVIFHTYANTTYFGVVSPMFHFASMGPSNVEFKSQEGQNPPENWIDQWNELVEDKGQVNPELLPIDLYKKQIQKKSKNRVNKFNSLDETLSPYLLELDHCLIPRLPNELSQPLTAKTRPTDCKNKDSISFLRKSEDVGSTDSDILVLDKSIEMPEKCCMYELTRPKRDELSPTANPDWFQLGDCRRFNESRELDVKSLEYLQVSCELPTSASSMNSNSDELMSLQKSPTLWNKFGHLISSLMASSNFVKHSFHARLSLANPNLEKKIKFWATESSTQKEPWSVMVIVLDSTSRASAFKQIPETMDLLLRKYRFIDFKGYHPLGEATMRNVIPLLTGIKTRSMYTKIKKDWTSSWDQVPFIWKEFGKLNYVTAYIEDDMNDAATFNYDSQGGFEKPPTDIYPRRVFTAQRSQKQSGQSGCIGGVPVYQFVLDYQFEIAKKLRARAPMFSVTWLNYPQHDYEGSLHEIEETAIDFFNSTLSLPNLLNDTLIMVMGDHAFYKSSPYSNTEAGLLDRRQILYLVRLPDRLAKIHPEFVRNIQFNSKRITSHYDVYQTFQHITKLASGSGTDIFIKNETDEIVNDISSGGSLGNADELREFGQSLLTRIPANRTCEMAGIPTRFCACNLPIPQKQGTNLDQFSLDEQEPFM